MAAPKNNQFWKQRAKHGRDLLFETPQLLLEAAFEYFEWCDKHPWRKNEFKEGRMRKIPTARPYTLTGLCIYLGASEKYWQSFKKVPTLSEDFLYIIEQIEHIIRTQKFEGAAVGAFNANIISRDLGLADKAVLAGDQDAPLYTPVLHMPAGVDLNLPSNTDGDK